MAARTVLSGPEYRIPEGTTPTFVADLVDETGAAVTSPITVTGKLYEASTGAVINGRDSFDLMPYVTGGHLAWTAAVADTQIVVPSTKAREAHRLVVRWTWGAGKYGAHEIEHYVARMGPA